MYGLIITSVLSKIDNRHVKLEGCVPLILWDDRDILRLARKGTRRQFSFVLIVSEGAPRAERRQQSSHGCARLPNTLFARRVLLSRVKRIRARCFNEGRQRLDRTRGTYTRQQPQPA